MSTDPNQYRTRGCIGQWKADGVQNGIIQPGRRARRNKDAVMSTGENTVYLTMLALKQCNDGVGSKAGKQASECKDIFGIDGIIIHDDDGFGVRANVRQIRSMRDIFEHTGLTHGRAGCKATQPKKPPQSQSMVCTILAEQLLPNIERGNVFPKSAGQMTTPDPDQDVPHKEHDNRKCLEHEQAVSEDYSDGEG